MQHLPVLPFIFFFPHPIIAAGTLRESLWKTKKERKKQNQGWGYCSLKYSILGNDVRYSKVGFAADRKCSARQSPFDGTARTLPHLGGPTHGSKSKSVRLRRLGTRSN